jgi:septal ring factor EnvC (AmiA/AmiB activator)
MGRRVARLLAALALAFAVEERPSWIAAVEAAPPSPAKKLQGGPARPAKAKGAASLKPGKSAPPLESETGPSESAAGRLSRIRARREAVEREIAKLRSQAESTLRELDEIDLDLRLAAHRLDEADLEFKETTRLLDATLRDVATTRSRIEATRPRVLKSLVTLNKLGELSYARLLLSIDDPADILRGYRYVSRIASTDAAQILEFRTSLTKLSGLEAKLKDRTAENLETRRQLAQARRVLSARKAHKEARVEEIALERQFQERLADEYQKQEAELLRLLGESADAVPSGPPAEPFAASKAPFHGDAPLRVRRGDLPWPVRGTLLRRFGIERDPRFGTQTVQHGIEIDAFPETEVRAVHAGRVVFADQFVGYGLLVIVDHGYREHTLYGRLGELKVLAGDDVVEGSLIGLLPDTRVTGTGLHFEVRVQGRPEDPMDWLKKP